MANVAHAHYSKEIAQARRHLLYLPNCCSSLVTNGRFSENHLSLRVQLRTKKKCFSKIFQRVLGQKISSIADKFILYGLKPYFLERHELK